MPFYAVANGRTNGVFLSWPECNEQIKGYSGAKYKKFDSREEAENFIQSAAGGASAPSSQKKLFFSQKVLDDSADAGATPAPAPELPFDPDYYVYTDGACSNNGKSNAAAGIGIFFGAHDPRNVSKRIDGKQTNNAAEITAVIETYNIIEQDIIAGKKIAIMTDSKYVILCVSSYGERCSKKNWTEDIPNKELVRTAYEMYKNKTNIRFIYVAAHTENTDIHSIGNDNADRLANAAINLEGCPYIGREKIYLTVPFAKKDEVKNLGGRWDAKNKKWFVYENNENMEKLSAFLPKI